MSEFSKTLQPDTRRGVLLVNLGSPSEPTTRAVRAFLEEFLSDPMVVDMQPQLWWLLRRLVILPRRGPRSARRYRTIWTPDGSPLITGSFLLSQALARELGPDVSVRLAMRYGEPSLQQALEAFGAEGVERVQVLPLFPQASRTTTGTIEVRLRELQAEMTAAPTLEFSPSYETHSGYIGALAQSVREHLHGAPCDHYLFSFHGLPVRYVHEGDVYRDDCEATAAALGGALGLGGAAWTLTYQSRFGRQPWLEPSTEEVAHRLCAEGQRIAVICPGFIVDCLETLEEMGVELVDSVGARGVGEVVLVPALNQRPDWVRALAGLVNP